jgi:predicted O-methyltransferase YrrM
VQVLVGDAREIIPKLPGSFDMVFLDAEKNEYLQYLLLVENKLHMGSVVVADNAGIFADQMSDYLGYVRSSGRYKSRYLPFGGDGVEVSVKL